MRFTTKGRITLLRDGVQISQHVLAEEAYERAYAHALANGPGKYTVRYPDREVDLSTLTRVVLEAAPAGLTTQAISSSQVNLTWTANPRAASYRVYRNSVLVGSPTTASYSDTGLSPSTAYTYTVSTVSATTGEGPQSAAVQGTTLAAPDTTAPTAPGITATPTGQNTISVALTTPATDTQSGVASYDLEYKTAAASTYTAITGLTAGQFPYVIGSLTQATTYNTRARARDGVGNVGPYSAVSNATTQAGVVTPGPGWTDLDALINSPAYASSRIVYVSTSGNDGTAQIYSPASAALGGVPTNPTGTVAPYATLAAAWNQVRDGQADVMLLRRGNDWGVTNFDLNKAGPNATSRMIVAAYGAPSLARPLVGLVRPNSSTAARNQIIAHIAMRTNSSGDEVFNGQTIRIEGCSFTGPAGTGQTPALVHNISGGLYLWRNSYFRIRIFGANVMGRAGFEYGECSFYHNPNYVSGGGAEHNIYFNFQEGDGISRFNISAYSPGVGLRQRGLGTVEGNLLLGSRAWAFDIGTTDDPDPTNSSRGTYLLFRYNLAMHGPNDVTLMAAPRNATIEHNIFRERLAYANATANGLSATNITLQDNVFYNTDFNPWGSHDGAMPGPWLTRRNDIQRPAGGGMFTLSGAGFTFENNNRYFSSSPQSVWFPTAFSNWVPSTGSNTQVSYSAPNRDLITYLQTVGLSPANADQAIEWFMNGTSGFAGAMNNRLGAWDDRATARAVTNHVRAGFGLGAIP